MTTLVKSKIKWHASKICGRQKLPAGPRYSTAARFDDDIESWPNQAWSVVLEFLEPPSFDQEACAHISFLMPEAPLHLLDIGSRFDLMEGGRVVASGVVISQEEI